MALLRIGLVSDTHGLLRPGALAFLQGRDLIIHGGDIGNAGILEALAGLAPLTVVRGNNDNDNDNDNDNGHWAVGGGRWARPTRRCRRQAASRFMRCTTWPDGPSTRPLRGFVCAESSPP